MQNEIYRLFINIKYVYCTHMYDFKKKIRKIMVVSKMNHYTKMKKKKNAWLYYDKRMSPWISISKN